MSQSRLDSCIQKAKEYKNSFNADNTYEGDENLLLDITIAYNSLDNKDKTKFKKHVMTKIENTRLSAEMQKVQNKAMQNVGVGAIGLTVLTDAYLGGSSIFTKVVSSIAGGGLGFFATPKNGELFDCQREVRRARKPYIDIAGRIGLIVPSSVSLEKAAYKLAEINTPQQEPSNQMGLRHR